MNTPTLNPSPPPLRTSHATDARAIAAAFYDAYEADDLAAASAFLAPEAVLHVPGSHPLAGDHQGLDAIITFVVNSEAAVASGSLTTDLVDVTGGTTYASALCEVTAERPGRAPLRNRTVHLLRIDNSRIAEIWFHNWDQPSVDRFWS